MSERIVQPLVVGIRAPWLTLRRKSSRLLIGFKDRKGAAKPSCPGVRERQDELIAFYDRFESLVEVLCDAAQKGPTDRLEEAYQNHRNWISGHYSPIRKFAVAFLRHEPEDAAQGLVLWGKSADAFEALVAAPSLEGFLQADDGSMISRINRTRKALCLYGEHLRQLAALAS